MKRTYYLFNDGRVSRKDNTLCFVARDKDGKEQPPKYIPIETIDTMYVFGALDVNAALLNYLGQRHISCLLYTSCSALPWIYDADSQYYFHSVIATQNIKNHSGCSLSICTYLGGSASWDGDRWIWK